MKHIVVVDDSLTMRKSVGLSLKCMSDRIVEAENGAVALEKINELVNNGNDIALCITDVNMPVMDGLTFIKEFRKIDKFTPVLMLTTESDNDVIENGKKAGASGWIIKPFKPDALLDTVNKLIL